MCSLYQLVQAAHRLVGERGYGTALSLHYVWPSLSRNATMSPWAALCHPLSSAHLLPRPSAPYCSWRPRGPIKAHLYPTPAQQLLLLWSASRSRPGANRDTGLLCTAPPVRARARRCSSSQLALPSSSTRPAKPLVVSRWGRRNIYKHKVS